MTNMELVKSERFGEIEADIYSNGNDMFMTINQLAECLGYSDRNGVQKIVDRNQYLNNPEFSTRYRLSLVEGGRNVTRYIRAFTEDGIYEITMLSSQPKAKEFRAWIRKVLKTLRKEGQVHINNMEAERIAAQRERSKAMLLNAQKRMFDTIMKTIDNKKLSPIAAEVFGIAALEQVTGKTIDYRPAFEKTYSATEIGKMLGLSSQKVGKTANRLGMKTDEYGITVMDKSRYSPKEVPAFRYNQHAVDKFTEIFSASKSTASI